MIQFSLIQNKSCLLKKSFIDIADVMHGTIVC
jgi:hypothetical protein